jgi:hypothetical protein
MLAVAGDALTQRDGRTVVFVVRGERAVAVPVTPGARIGELTAIAGEVKSGVMAVLKPAAELPSGALVKAAQK